MATCIHSTTSQLPYHNTVNCFTGKFLSVVSIQLCAYRAHLIRKLSHMVGQRPPLVLPWAHAVSLGVLLPPWTWSITLGGTILHVTKLLWPRSIVSWRGEKKNCELQYKTKPAEFHFCVKPVNWIFIKTIQDARGYPTIYIYNMLMVITTYHHTPQNLFVMASFILGMTHHY